MTSRIFDSYPPVKKREVIEKLLIKQGNLCLFDNEPISYSPSVDLNNFLQNHEVDHIIPLTEKTSRDDDSNWALLHKECNDKKGARPLYLAKTLNRFQKDREDHADNFTLGKALEINGIEPQPILLRIDGDLAEVRYYDDGSNKNITVPIWHDPTGTQFDSLFMSLPLTHIFHDGELNPRLIGENAEKLIEEFYKENPYPQLHVCLCRIEEVEEQGDFSRVKVLLFDGQHKAAAQVYNDKRHLLLRVFVKGDKDQLKEANLRAHTSLRQIEFFRSIAARVGSGLFAEKFSKYLEGPAKPKSEHLFVSSLEFIERSKTTREFESWLKHGILHPKEVNPQSKENLMTPYIEEEKSRKRLRPISYDGFEKTIMKYFVYMRPAEDEIEPSSEEYFRDIERENVVRLMSLIAQKALINKFDEKEGAHKIEERIRRGKKIRGGDSHIRAFRIFRPKSFEVWCEQLHDGVVNKLKTRRKLSDINAKHGKVFWSKLDESDWEDISKMLDRVVTHSIWLSNNIEIIDAINSTRKEVCEKLLKEGVLGGRKVIDNPLDFKYIVEV